jgi:glycosyltransferase involved in cell wall biosynthesis
MKHRPRLAVVSPFLDKRHGTERRVVEWISQLAEEFEIHIYSQRVEDLDLSTVTWHRVPRLPGPHLFGFLWWLAANHFFRAWDRRFRGLQYDVVYSPGPNCLDADVISVHILFAEYVRRAEPKISFTRNSVRSWPRLVHRKLYYRLAIALEHLAYTQPRVTLFSISRKTAADLGRLYGRHDPVRVIYAGLDHAKLNSERRLALRERARNELGLAEEHFVLILIGNDWHNKGLPVLLQALAVLRPLPIRLLVVSGENSTACAAAVRDGGLDDCVRILPPRNDVERYYAAADLCAGPSLEDAFALPPAEAMACGLPVIVSASTGVSEIITDGADGLILQNPTDSNALVAMIRRLYEDREYRDQLGRNAEKTARQYTWERNGRELASIFEDILSRKARLAPQPLAQERDA